LGSKYAGQLTGTFGDIATLSFYPAHHITTAEGGAVLTDNPELSKLAISIRDWGRHCWCPTGKDNTCKNRFNWQLGELPKGYDHKYIYGEVGYNLKISDLHSAIGLAQIEKLKKFVEIRKRNFNLLTDNLKQFEKYLVLPKATSNSEPSWFGYLITLKSEIDRRDLLKYLEEQKIGTRLLFAGNLIRQPYFERFVEGRDYRLASKLTNTDIVMNQTFWIGLSPLTTGEMVEKIANVFSDYFRGLKNG
jgi:CDP-6-deoxy-D-xylo-4-hexulose-3-dehydrase